MIHGGIRYLENGEFRLVHEAVTERNGLLRIAPHYVRPLQTTIPIFSTFSGVLSAPLRFLRHGGGKHTERGAALIKIGLVIYDSFSRGGGRVPRHAFHGRRKSLELLPHLNPDLKYTATYWDASLHDPERLAIDVLRDGLAAGGDRARAANYTAAVGVDDGRDRAARSAHRRRDAVRGIRRRQRLGPVDRPHQPRSAATPPNHMGGTKGSHIVLDHPELLAATGGRELFFENKDGRIVLIYPLKGRVLVGTTDLEHDMADPIVCTEAEVDYFIDLVRQVLPDIAVDRDRRSSTGSPASGRCPATATSPPASSRATTASSRRRSNGRTDATVLSLVGGKWTTFRASAEHLADACSHLLARPRRRSTKGVPIGGGRGYPTTERARRQWIDAHSEGLPAGPRRDAARPLRHGRGRRDRGDRRRSRRCPARDAARLQHRRAAPPRPHRGGRAPRRRADAAHEPRVHGRGRPPTSALEVAEAIAPVMGWDAAACARRDRAGARAGARGGSELDGRGIRSLDRVAIA